VRLILELKRDADPDVVLEPALPVLAAADVVLADLPGARRRQAADPVASRICWRSFSATATAVIRRRTQHLLAEGPQPQAHARGPARRAGRTSTR
jgi:hypothetical protein